MVPPMFTRLALLLPLAVVAACSGERAPPPQPAAAPQPRPVATPAPRPAPTPAPVGWADLPLTPGTWAYDTSGGVTSARFGTAEAQFIVRCDPSTRRVRLLRSGSPAAPTMSVRTSFGARIVGLTPLDGPGSFVGAELSPSDPFLDSMIFSRGRFSVEITGTPTLIIPSWAEPARVVEDCRRLGS